MKTVTISLTVDTKVKEEAEKIAKEQGFSLNTLVNIFLKEFILRGRRLLQQQEEERNKGGHPKQFNTADELIQHLFPEIA